MKPKEKRRSNSKIERGVDGIKQGAAIGDSGNISQD